jgi:hypothetical protein
MIDEKKLLCAFIYSAYQSGYCGLKLGRDVKEKHMKLYKDYLSHGGYYPEKEIEETQKKMMDSISTSSIRDYLYRGHFEVVRGRIEKETGIKFEDAVKSHMILLSSLSCPVNLYEVIAANDSFVVGKNLFFPGEKNLMLLNGLEKPNIGDIVSGHWNYFLEKVSDWEDFEKYKQYAKEHIDLVKYNV